MTVTKKTILLCCRKRRSKQRPQSYWINSNALLKARYYAKASGKPCMADDSGLEVDALSGAPGVISARYSGATGGRGVRLAPGSIGRVGQPIQCGARLAVEKSLRGGPTE